MVKYAGPDLVLSGNFLVLGWQSQANGPKAEPVVAHICWTSTSFQKYVNFVQKLLYLNHNQKAVQFLSMDERSRRNVFHDIKLYI